jgi:hypothetical protein
MPREATEIYLIDSELKRDALYAVIWTRLCVDVRQGTDPEQNLDHYIERFSNERGDPAEVFRFLDEDIESLTTARRMLRAVEGTALGAEVQLEDVERFMPCAWRESGPTGPGVWIYTDSEAEEADLLAPEAVIRLRPPGPPEYGL